MGLQDKEKLLAELQGHYTPLKAELAKGTSRADAQLQQDLRSHMKRLKISNNEIYCTNSLILAVENMLCSKLHRQKV